MVTKQIKFKKPLDSAGVIALLYSSGDGPAPSVLFTDGSRKSVDENMEALAWRAWPPIYTSKLVTGIIKTDGKHVSGIDPGGRSVWAVTTGIDENDPYVIQSMNYIKSANNNWQAILKEERSISSLSDDAASIPDGSVAILPPEPKGEAADLMHRIGLSKKSVILTPEQLIDHEYFNAKRFPVVFYAAGEDYIETVKSPGDAADAVIRYVKEGGTICILSGGATFPMHFANGPGYRRGDPLVFKLGLPIGYTLETKPEDSLVYKKVQEKNVLSNLPSQVPYSTADVRLRAIDKTRLEPGTIYHPIYTVTGKSGKNYGDAAVLLEFPNSHGRILYIYGMLTRDSENGPAITQSAIRYLIDAAKNSNINK